MKLEKYEHILEKQQENVWKKPKKKEKKKIVEKVKRKTNIENKNKTLEKPKAERPTESVTSETRTEILEKTEDDLQEKKQGRKNLFVKPKLDKDIPRLMTNYDYKLSLKNSIDNKTTLHSDSDKIGLKERKTFNLNDKNLENEMLEYTGKCGMFKLKRNVRNEMNSGDTIPRNSKNRDRDYEEDTGRTNHSKKPPSSSTPKKKLKRDLFKPRLQSPIESTRKGRGISKKIEENKTKSKVKMMVENFENDLKRVTFSLEPKPKLKRNTFSLEPKPKLNNLLKANPFISSNATKKLCDQSDEPFLNHPRQLEHHHIKDCYNWSDRGEMENLDQ